MSCWTKLNRKPNDEERKITVGLVIKIVVVICLKNHCYQTDGKIYQQKKNGLIGPDIQRAMCHNYVMRWNNKFIELCKVITENSRDENININPEVFQTFVDDTKNVVKELPPNGDSERER